MSLTYPHVRKIILAGLAGALLCIPVHSYSQVKVTRVSGPENMAGRKGVVYSLPRTVLTFRLEITRTDKVPGPYASFANELLGIDEVITTGGTSYSLEHVTISSYSEPDPDQVFLVEPDEKASEATLLNFSDNGLIMGSRPFEEEEAREADLLEKYETPSLSDAELFPLYKAAKMKETIDTIIRVVTFDTITYREKILKRLLVEQTDREKAVEAVSMINSIGQDQYSLLVGYQETPYSYEAIKYMNDKLEEQRQNYLRLFTGITRTEKFSVSFTVTPTSEMMGSDHEICGFSSDKGVVAADGNDMVFMKISGLGNTASLSTDAPAVPVVSGYYYRVPENCNVSLTYHDEVIGTGNFTINQAGVIRNLASTITQVEFNPVTGAIKRVLLK